MNLKESPHACAYAPPFLNILFILIFTRFLFMFFKFLSNAVACIVLFWITLEFHWGKLTFSLHFSSCLRSRSEKGILMYKYEKKWTHSAWIFYCTKTVKKKRRICRWIMKYISPDDYNYKCFASCFAKEAWRDILIK